MQAYATNKDILEQVLHLAGRGILKRTDDYIKVDCALCSREAYVYYSSAFLIGIQCNHSNSCGHVETLDVPEEYFVIAKKQDEEDKVQYLEDHGLDVDRLVASGVLTKQLEIPLLEGFSKKLLRKKGKFTWTVPKGFTKKKGEMYPVLVAGKDTIYIFEGDCDWQLGLLDGLACTSSLFGCKSTTIKLDITWAMLSAYKHIRICYDNDKHGEKCGAELAYNIAKKFPRMDIAIVKLPFDGPEGKDYCDWRKDHTLDEFLKLDAISIDPDVESEKKAIAKLEQKALDKVRASDAIEGDVLQLVEGVDAKWQITTKGVYKVEEIMVQGKPTGQFETKRILSQQVKVENMYQDIESNSVVVVISVDGAKIEVPLVEMMQTSQMKRLVERGVRINTKFNQFVADFFDRCLETTPSLLSSAVNGWRRGGFVLGQNFIEAKGISPMKFTGVGYTVGSKGCRKAWAQEIAKFQDDPQLAMVLGASAISPFVTRIGCNSFTLHVYGLSSMGKTFGSIMGASLWGNHKQIMEQWRQSEAGSETYFQEAGSLPVFLEESHQVQNQNVVVQTVYKFGNEKGKGRGTWANNRVARVKSVEFSGVLISSGESQISTIDKAGGNQARLIEILRKPPHTGKEMSAMVNSAKQVLKRNHGWCGIEIIEYYLANQDMIEDKFDEYYEMLLGILDGGNELQNRQQPYFAAVLTGCWILREIGVEIAAEDAVVLAIDEMLKSLKPVRTTDAAIRAIESLVASNIKRFYRKGMSTSGDDDSVEPANDGEYWGRYDDRDNLVHFFPTIFDREMERLGFDPSILELLNSQDRVIRSKGKTRYQVKISGKNEWLISIKLGDPKDE